jgi:predicted NAD-dependent protein-ADP-ribosyltransferase YbiA (DUF1768 family)
MAEPLLIDDDASLLARAAALDATASVLVRDVREHLRVQWVTARESISEELDVAKHLNTAEPARWLEMGRADIQTGVMKIVRSIMQPT